MEDWSPLRAYASKRHPLPWADLTAALIILGLGAALAMKASSLPIYHWNWEALRDFLIRRDPSGNLRPGLLLLGLATTLRIGFWVGIFALILGSVIAFLSLHKSFFIKWPLAGLITVTRNTPPLVILFAVYFFAGNLLPVAEIENAIRHCPAFIQHLISLIFAPEGKMDGMLAAVIALGCYQSAFVAEILRGSLQAVPSGQWDAAMALGFSRSQALRLVILPQALRLIIPPLTGQCISIFKESALASLISLPDLTFQSLEIMAVSNLTFEIWIVCAFLYLIIGLICAWIGKMTERHYTYESH